MLVLSRKLHERLILSDRHGNQIGFVEVVRIGADAVRLGVQMPLEYVVSREELEDAANRKPQPCRTRRANRVGK